MKTAVRGMLRPSASSHAGQTVVDDRQPLDATVDDLYAARCERRTLVRGNGRRVCEENDVVRPLPEQLRMVCGTGTRPDDADRLVAHLPAVAVRAMQEVAAPAFAGAGDVRQLVGAPVATRIRRPCQPRPAARPARESGLDRDDLVVDQLHAVTDHLSAAGGQEVAGRHAVAREEAVHLRRGSVARLP